MKVIVDDKIPYIKGNIEQVADEVIYLPGNQFVSETIQDADALIIRTRTLCNRELLEGSRVKFIATVSIILIPNIAGMQVSHGQMLPDAMQVPSHNIFILHSYFYKKRVTTSKTPV